MAASTYDRFDLSSAPLNQGTVLLEASAGTGKTYALTGILVRMLLEDVVGNIEQALVVTFTEAATEELKNRLRQAIQDAHRVCLNGSNDDDEPFFQSLAPFGKKGAAKLRTALDEFDQASVMTIHGFCKRLLDEAAFESKEPFDLDFVGDEATICKAAAADALRLMRKHDSLVLGAALKSSKLDPPQLATLYRAWQRYPDVALEPSEPQLRVHLDNLRAAIHSAASQWDDDVLTRLAEVKWRKNKLPDFANAFATINDKPELCLETLVEMSTTRIKANIYNSSHKFIADIGFLAACEDARTQWLVTLDHLRVELMLKMHERLCRHKSEKAVLTYDDLLNRTHAAITDPTRRTELLTALRDRYSVALIDEFQDTDDRQYAILSQSFENRPVFLVGDPKQSIYGFRGADLRTYLGAVNDAVQKNTLTTNFRSSENLVAAVNQLFARTGSFVEPSIRMHKVRAHATAGQLEVQPDNGAAMRFRLLPYEIKDSGEAANIKNEDALDLIGNDVAQEIRSLLDGSHQIDGQRLLPQHIAVLTRSNAQASLIQEHLQNVGVVAVIGKAGDVFETDERVEIQRLLHAIQHPNDNLRARAALTTRLWGFDAAQLANLESDPTQLDREMSRLESWRHIWNTKGFIVMAGQLLETLNAEARMLRWHDGERRLTNISQLCEMLHQAEHDNQLSPEGLLHWLRQESSQKSDVDTDHRALRLESDEDAVKIATMHSSKGLQYEVVFCPFLWQATKARKENVILTSNRTNAGPSERTFAFAVQTNEPAWLGSETDRIAEDCRLSYVALTRAKRRCYVHWGPLGGNGQYAHSGLAWLLQPEAVDQSRDQWQTNWDTAYKKRSGHLAEDLRAIADRSHGAISVEQVSDNQAQVTDQSDQAHNSQSRNQCIVTAVPLRELPRRNRRVIHSFSSLVADSEPGTHAHEVRDPAKHIPAEGNGIFGFARGAKAGLCLHDVLEHVDLDAIETQHTHDLVADTLTQHGFLDQGAHPGDLDPCESVLKNLRDIASARTHTDGPTVGEICGQKRLAEWQFTLPMERPDLKSLASIFEDSGCPVATQYAPRLRQLSPQQLGGYLTGLADLITEHDGRYWIIDWKSNHLGNVVDDYGPAALLQSMQEHDYILQYHLYTVAWHRHLCTRLTGYDYDKHFAGVSYAFLRGATTDATTGMFYARPPRKLIEGLDDWIRGGRS